MFRQKRIIPIPVETDTAKVLLLVDWENVFLSLFTFVGRFGPGRMQLDYRFKKLMEWIKSDVGELLGGCGFVFAPSHFSPFDIKLCVQNNLKIVICPKKEIKDKTGTKEEDMVDEIIVWFGLMMTRHPEVKFICLVSGDDDYVPMLEEVKKKGIKIALVPPTIDSLSRSKRLIKLIDKHPETGKKMILVLEKVC